MKTTIQQILDWSEVWALLIPLTVFLIRRPKAGWIRPVIYYVFIALLLNLSADIIWKRNTLGIAAWINENLTFFYDPKFKQVNNNIFYNTHSIIRVLLFTWFFKKLDPTYFNSLNKFVIPLFLLFVSINFIFFTDIKHLLNSLLFSVEAFILLLYCILYFIRTNNESRVENPFSQPSFRVVSGLTFYNSINLPIFLFYDYLVVSNETYSEDVWTVHNVSYIIFNIFLAFSFKK